MNNWLYENKVIIKNLETGLYYIGKKQLQSKINKKLGKKELAELPIQRGRKVTKKLVISESNWKDYWGSCKPLLEDLKNLGEDKFKREILMICKSKKLLTYWEAAFQMKEDVLLKETYNDTILSHYYRKDFQ